MPPFLASPPRVAMADISGPRGPREPRFVCDEMLKRLARWLRAAGYDTLVHADGASDRAMVALARREGRLVVTRDRKLSELRGAEGTVIVLRANTLQGTIDELTVALDLNWLHRPFTRCLVCNAPLAEADDEARNRLPEGARNLPGAVRFCPPCDKLYWAGGHVRRMRARLEAWASNAPAPALPGKTKRRKRM